MVTNALLISLKPKIRQIARASHLPDILSAVSQIRRQTQLSYFENQKPENQPSLGRQTEQHRRTTPQSCKFCQFPGHSANDWRLRQFQNQYRPQIPISPRSSSLFRTCNRIIQIILLKKTPIIRPNPNF